MPRPLVVVPRRLVVVEHVHGRRVNIVVWAFAVEPDGCAARHDDERRDDGPVMRPSSALRPPATLPLGFDLVLERLAPDARAARFAD
jgi:hypothetical protein